MGATVLAEAAASRPQRKPAGTQQARRAVAAPKIDSTRHELRRLIKVPSHKAWKGDPPPRVDPMPERALRLRLVDAPSITGPPQPDSLTRRTLALFRTPRTLPHPSAPFTLRTLPRCLSFPSIPDLHLTRCGGEIENAAVARQ